jgi:hypothetical protein
MYQSVSSAQITCLGGSQWPCAEETPECVEAHAQGAFGQWL